MDAVIKPPFATPTGEWIRQLLERYDVSQAAVCRTLEVDRSYFNQVLSGRRSASRQFIHSLANACGWSVDELEWALVLRLREEFGLSLREGLVRHNFEATGFRQNLYIAGVEATLDQLVTREIEDGTFSLFKLERNLSKISTASRAFCSIILSNAPFPGIFSSSRMCVHATYPLNYFSIDALAQCKHGGYDGLQEKILDELSCHVVSSVRSEHYFSPEIQHSIHLLGRLGAASLVPEAAKKSSDVFLRRASIAAEAHSSNDIEFADWVLGLFDKDESLIKAFIAIELAYYGAIRPPALSLDIDNAHDPVDVVTHLAGSVFRRANSPWSIVCSRLAIEIGRRYQVREGAHAAYNKMRAAFLSAHPETPQARRAFNALSHAASTI